jgi:hypothetical protein
MHAFTSEPSTSTGRNSKYKTSEGNLHLADRSTRLATTTKPFASNVHHTHLQSQSSQSHRWLIP